MLHAERRQRTIWSHLDEMMKRKRNLRKKETQNTESGQFIEIVNGMAMAMEATVTSSWDVDAAG